MSIKVYKQTPTDVNLLSECRNRYKDSKRWLDDGLFRVQYSPNIFGIKTPDFLAVYSITSSDLYILFWLQKKKKLNRTYRKAFSKARLLAFYGLTWKRKLENPEKTTHLEPPSVHMLAPVSNLRLNGDKRETYPYAIPVPRLFRTLCYSGPFGHPAKYLRTPKSAIITP